MALILSSSTSQYWTRSVGQTRNSFGGQTSNGPGFTMMTWVRQTGALTAITSANALYVASFASISTESLSSFALDYNSVIYAVDSDDAGASAQYAKQFSLTTGQWICVVTQFQSNAKQAYYTTASTTPLTIVQGSFAQTAAATFPTLFIGSFPTTNIPFGPAAASNLVNIAEVAIWRGILGPSEVQNLFGGESPSNVRSDILYAHYPLRNDLSDLGPQRTGLTPVGGVVASYTDHPPVKMPMLKVRGFAGVVSNNIISETGAATDTTTKTVSFASSSVSESGSATDTTTETVSFASSSVSESGSAVDAASEVVTFATGVVSETGAATDTTSETVSFASSSVSESGSASDTTSETVSFASSSVSESGSASDAITATNSFAASVINESGSASDTTSYAYFTTGVVSETGNASDTTSLPTISTNIISETGSASDLISETFQTYAIAAESGSAVDTPNSTYTTLGLISETGAAIDSPATTIITTAAVSERGTAFDTTAFNGSIYPVGVPETGNATDLVNSLATFASVVSETGSALDATTAMRVLTPIVSETGNAVDATSFSYISYGNIVELGNAQDAKNFIPSTYNASVTDILFATDTIMPIQNSTVYVIETGTAIDTTDGPFYRPRPFISWVD